MGVVTKQNVFVHFERFLHVMQTQDPPRAKVLGSWRIAQAAAIAGGTALAGVATAVSSAVTKANSLVRSSWQLDTQFFAMSRDVFSILSAPELMSRLRSKGQDAAYGDLALIAGGVNAWLRGLAIDRVSLPGMHLQDIGAPNVICPSGALALHPVSVERLQALSGS